MKLMLKLPKSFKFPKISTMVSKITNLAKKHSPEILTVLGVTGSVSAVFLAVKATPEAHDLLMEEDDRRSEELMKDYPKDYLTQDDFCKLKIGTTLAQRFTIPEIIKICWKPYVPALVTEGLAIACIIGSNRISSNRGAALAAACTISEEAFKDYKNQVAEEVGEKKEKEISDSAAQKKIERMPVNESDVVLTGHGNTLFYDPFVARYFRSDMEFVRKCINDLDQRIYGGMEFFVSLDDFYYEMGLPRGKIGKDLGWNADYPLKEDFSYRGATNGEPCAIMEFEYPPQYAYKDLYGC